MSGSRMFRFPISDFRIPARSDVDELLAFVEAAPGADAVRRLRLVTVGTFRKRGSRERVVRAALVAAGFALAVFRIRHGGSYSFVKSWSARHRGSTSSDTQSHSETFKS